MTQNTFRFQNKIALITGGTSGMGLATAHRLLAEGATVIITGRDKNRLDTAAAELGHAASAGTAAERILAVPGDIAVRADLDTRRIRVNSVSPGYIETPMLHENIPATAYPGIIASVPADRLGTADDITAAVAFLGSSEASYINGQDLVIDGGLVATI
ncbi:SDR family oxidoreductase [Nocardia sp. SYP-A9097]|uniref:SDR family NAD(P)-dependent oxidoreductase n=1 Tax=Nocardia sp. SYP-A9097 TaxID=2663237 RepID=UPI00129A29CE|nr:SDR family oxidoreductase [Nocardia sp. SYP-A9097]MRH89910.1 SDR family oxidoreductase [Nocardia sp. SYP-A9097]